MEMLDEMGIPIYSERGPDGGFSLVRGYKMPPLVFTPEEAVAVFLGAGLVAKMWGDLCMRRAPRARWPSWTTCCRRSSGRRRRGRVGSLVSAGLNRMPAEPMSPHLTALREAIREQRTVHMVYASAAGPAATERDFDPYALVHRTGWWYAVGHCHLRGAMRTFRVDRVVRLEPTGTAFELPDGFDIHDYLERERRNFGALRVTMRFAPDGANFAREYGQQWDEMEELADGSVRVTYAVPDLNWAASMVLSYGGLAVAEGPPELLARVRVGERDRGAICAASIGVASVSGLRSVRGISLRAKARTDEESDDVKRRSD